MKHREKEVTLVSSLFAVALFISITESMASEPTIQSTSVQLGVAPGVWIAQPFQLAEGDDIHIRILNESEGDSDFVIRSTFYFPKGKTSSARASKSHVEYSFRANVEGTYRLVITDDKGVNAGQVRIEFLNVRNPGVGSVSTASGSSGQPDAAVSTSNETQPDTQSLNPGKRAIVSDLLAAYGEGADGDIDKVADAADQAVLAWAAYESGSDQKAMTLARERGWELIGTYNYQHKLSGDTVAKLFRHIESGHTTLTFRGTAEAGDWVTNTNSVANQPILNAQVEDTKRIAMRVATEYPNVTFTGHSLGGRLAQVARLTTGGAATVFNTAPLGLSESDELFASSLRKRSPGPLVSLASPQDPLRDLRVKTRTNDIVVKNVIETDANWIGRVGASTHFHGVEAMVQAMQDVRIARDEGWIDTYRKEARTNSN